MTAALADLHVLDISTSLAGAWCSRLLADFGADVVMVEPPQGHPLRRLKPLAPDGASIPARYVQANKRSVVLDLDTDEGREALASLAEASDIVIDSGGGEADALADAWTEHHQETVLVSITPHGLTGARCHWPGNDLTAFALSGWASTNGLAEREPIKGSGFIASYVAGTAAYGAILVALLERERSGAGQRIDVAEDETLLEIYQAAFLHRQHHGEARTRREEISIVGTFPVPVKDGHLSLTLPAGDRFRDAMIALGLEQLADDERFNKPRPQLARDAAFSAIVEAKLLERDRADLFEALAVLRISPGPVLYMDELARNEQLRARDFFVRPADAADGPEYPGAPFKMSETPWVLRRSQPQPGEHTVEVLAALARAPATRRRRSAVAGGAPAPSRPPLAGVRAVVLTHAWLGTLCTELLALNGAEVIQIEARRRPDVWRGGYEAPIPQALAELPSAKHGWNCNSLYNSVNLNKRGITVDLQTSEGLDIFRGLVETADVVVENFSPRVMANLGIDYQALREIKPNLVMASLCAYGQTGPWRDVLGIGGTVEPTSGMSSLLGYPDSQPLNSGQMLPDPVGGYYGFAAIVTALLHRERTGEGQYIDLSMQEANHTFVGDASLEYMLTGNVRQRLANRHLTFAPHGIYPAKPADGAQEQWIALAAESEEQWRALCEVAGHLEWLDDPRFVDNEARKANEDALDDALRVWTSAQQRDALAARLAAAGVIAAPVFDATGLAEDPVFRDRGVVVDVTHPETGTHPQVGIPYHYSRTPIAVTGHSPMHGEHSAEVFESILGMSTERYEQLVEMGVTGMGPPDDADAEDTS